MRRLVSSAFALLSGVSAPAFPALSARRIYQRLRPVTGKNIGRDWLKSGSGARYPHSSARQQARYARQIAAGRLRFLPARPTGHPGRAFAREGGIR